MKSKRTATMRAAQVISQLATTVAPTIPSNSQETESTRCLLRSADHDRNLVGFDRQEVGMVREGPKGEIEGRRESRRRDLNSRPMHYECIALPTELQRQIDTRANLAID